MLSGIDHPKRLEAERAPLPDSPDRGLSADAVGGVIPHIRLHPADPGRSCRDHARGPGDSRGDRGAPGRHGSRRFSRKSVCPLVVGRCPGQPGRFHFLPGLRAGTDSRRSGDQHPAGTPHDGLDYRPRASYRDACGGPPGNLARPGPVGNHDVSGVGSHLLGGPVPDSDLRGHAEVAAEFRLSFDLRRRRDREPALSAVAVHRPRRTECSAHHSTDPSQYAGGVPRGLCAHRAGQGHAPGQGGGPAHIPECGADGGLGNRIHHRRADLRGGGDGDRVRPSRGRSLWSCNQS